ITDKGEKIADYIMVKLERGVTLLEGKGAYTGNNKSVLLCAVNHRYEINRIKDIVYELDENAFVLIGDMTEIMGDGF
ncbi:MAG: YitT family protein, partial [Lachnospiraceae bacterium]|nr:YitT family protein [Lachnospiraceae bacterium]